MQVRPRDPSGRTNLAEDLAGLDPRTALHVDLAHVTVHRDEPFTVIDDDHIAGEEEVAGLDDPAIGGGVNGRAGGRRDIHASVRTARLVVEDASQPK